MIKQTALLAVALFGSANAMCANQCSGHGVCKATPKDSCQCYTRRETYDEFGTFSDVVAWTGADCSLRKSTFFSMIILLQASDCEALRILEPSFVLLTRPWRGWIPGLKPVVELSAVHIFLDVHILSFNMGWYRRNCQFVGDALEI